MCLFVSVCSPCSKLDITAVSCHRQHPNVLWAKEILKSDLLALPWFKWASWLVQTDWQRCLYRRFVLFLAVYSASPLSSHMMTLKEPASILQDLERMNLLLCSKCFIWRIWKEIQERDDKFCVAPLQSCKEPCGEKSNLQSYNMRTWNNMSREVEPSGSGSRWVKVIWFDAMYKQKAFL